MVSNVARSRKYTGESNQYLIYINYFHKRDFHLKHKYKIFNQDWSFIERHVNGMTTMDTISGYYSDQDQSQRLQKPLKLY